MTTNSTSTSKATIIGAGLAGSEAAWQLASRGFKVKLYEMRPQVKTKAHKTADFAELVCSNSFRGSALSNAVGLLKEELRSLDSLIMKAADLHAVAAGGALAVDRHKFSTYISQLIKENENIEISNEEVTEIPPYSLENPLIIATGPLTSKNLMKSIRELTGEDHLSFFDAISPILLGESLDTSKVFRQSRYDKGGDDYLNIPFSEEEYNSFIERVTVAEKYGGQADVENDSIENLKPFEGCMPIEEMISRGPETPRFGPLKPVGLTDPNTGKEPHAVMQLRMDDKEGKLWSMVGMQTRMTRGAQKEIFGSLTGLQNAEFVRYGSVHRNSFINSPKCLNSTLEFRGKEGLFFAGQMTGVEGYVESTSGGMLAGLNVEKILSGQSTFSFPSETAIGALMAYISDPERKDFQPMNISFGLMPSYLDSPYKRMKKRERRLKASELSLEALEEFKTKTLNY